MASGTAKEDETARLLDQTGELTVQHLMEFFAKAFKESQVDIDPGAVHVPDELCRILEQLQRATGRRGTGYIERPGADAETGNCGRIDISLKRIAILCIHLEGEGQGCRAKERGAVECRIAEDIADAGPYMAVPLDAPEVPLKQFDRGDTLLAQGAEHGGGGGDLLHHRHR